MKEKPYFILQAGITEMIDRGLGFMSSLGKGPWSKIGEITDFSLQMCFHSELNVDIWQFYCVTLYMKIENSTISIPKGNSYCRRKR